jgi:hypothetical protein
MAQSRVVDRDLGYKRFIRNLEALGKADPIIEVGVRASTAGADLVLIATVNEFGSANGHVPERSFIRSTADENREKYGRLSQRAVTRGIDKGVGEFERELGKVGAVMAGDVQRKIITLSRPPNAPSTIAKKGSDSPLVDTGRLGQSIDFVVKI